MQKMLDKFNKLRITIIVLATILTTVYIKLKSIYSIPQPVWTTKAFILFLEILLTVAIVDIFLLIIFKIIRKYFLILLHKAQEGEENVNEIKRLMEKLSKQTKFLNEKLEENTALNKIIFEMNQTMELEKILKIILERICYYLNFDRAAILILDEERQILEPKFGYNIEENKLKELTISTSNSEFLLIKILLKNTPTIVKKIPTDFLRYKYFDDIKSDSSFICLPLQTRKRTLGLLLADTHISKRKLSEKDLRLMISFANQASLAIENARLFETERRFKEKLQEEVDIAIKKLQEAQKQLIQSEKLAALGEMAAIVSHEVRNPLSTILMSAQILNEDIKDEKHRKYIKYIISEVNRLSKVVSEILTFSKIPRLELKKVDIHKLLDELINFLEISDFLKYDIKYYKIYNAKISEFLIDPDQIKQTLLNIIQNAVHFMVNRPIRNLTILTDIEDHVFVIKIKDTGLGIPTENLKKIFEPFFTTKTKGTGLGLTICRNIVEAHGGKIEVESELGEGSTFIIKLPMKLLE